MKLKNLVGSGDKIMLFTLPFLAAGLTANILEPSAFSVGGPPAYLKFASVAVLVPGVAMWLWSVVLILTKTSRGKLITTGPFSLVKHPLYTGVSLLVLPWAGFLLNSWLGALLGIAVYTGSRIFSGKEEAALSEAFGPAWNLYLEKVKIPWL
jgi:protein-S-isoprenylcysteine O-methyltransferase Ste14